MPAAPIKITLDEKYSTQPPLKITTQELIDRLLKKHLKGSTQLATGTYSLNISGQRYDVTIQKPICFIEADIKPSPAVDDQPENDPSSNPTTELNTFINNNPFLPQFNEMKLYAEKDQFVVLSHKIFKLNQIAEEKSKTLYAVVSPQVQSRRVISNDPNLPLIVRDQTISDNFIEEISYNTIRTMQTTEKDELVDDELVDIENLDLNIKLRQVIAERDSQVNEIISRHAQNLANLYTDTHFESSDYSTTSTQHTSTHTITRPAIPGIPLSKILNNCEPLQRGELLIIAHGILEELNKLEKVSMTNSIGSKSEVSDTEDKTQTLQLVLRDLNYNHIYYDLENQKITIDIPTLLAEAGETLDFEEPMVENALHSKFAYIQNYNLRLKEKAKQDPLFKKVAEFRELISKGVQAEFKSQTNATKYLPEAEQYFELAKKAYSALAQKNNYPHLKVPGLDNIDASINAYKWHEFIHQTHQAIADLVNPEINPARNRDNLYVNRMKQLREIILLAKKIANTNIISAQQDITQLKKELQSLKKSGHITTLDTLKDDELFLVLKRHYREPWKIQQVATRNTHICTAGHLIKNLFENHCATLPPTNDDPDIENAKQQIEDIYPTVQANYESMTNVFATKQDNKLETYQQNFANALQKQLKADLENLQRVLETNLKDVETYLLRFAQQSPNAPQQQPQQIIRPVDPKRGAIYHDYYIPIKEQINEIQQLLKPDNNVPIKVSDYDKQYQTIKKLLEDKSKMQGLAEIRKGAKKLIPHFITRPLAQFFAEVLAGIKSVKATKSSWLEDWKNVGFLSCSSQSYQVAAKLRREILKECIDSKTLQDDKQRKMIGLGVS